MNKFFIILVIVLLGIIFSTLAGCYPYDEFAPRAREIIIFEPVYDPAPPPPPYKPIIIIVPPVDNPVVNDPAKIKYRKDNPDRTDERRSGDETKTRNQDGGRNQTSRR
ncbi:MAG: hypothetical protein C4539_18340 [Ignavibacteriales bacterium]|nr:MAG: hypothetical protein C4539_18340 [Ignavibacteriales bacterium]